MRSRIEIDSQVDALAIKYGLVARSKGAADDDRDSVFYTEAFKLFDDPDERAVAVLRADVLLAWFNGTGPLPTGYDQ